MEKVPPFSNGKSRDQAATLVGVNPRYISTLKAFAARAPELENEVKIGRLNVREARRLSEISADQRKSVLDHVKSGENFEEARREVFREDLAKTAPMEDSDGCTLFQGDFWEQAQEIPEGSVDAIITDPPYNKSSLPVFSKLPLIALRCLKPGGLLIFMPGNMFLPEVMEQLKVEGLNYQWMLNYMTPGPQSRAHARHVLSSWKPFCGT